PVQPLAQRLGGGEIADAQHEVVLVRVRPGAVAQQRVVVRDGRGAAAGAGERRGEQRQRAGSAKAASDGPSCGSRSARPATSTARGRAIMSAAIASIER